MGLRQGRSDGTTQGYDVGKRGGKPHSTTQDAGYDVGQSAGGHMVLPERLAMMLVAVEVDHVIGHVLSISLIQ